jgi:SAM-dependent methyltransferase
MLADQPFDRYAVVLDDRVAEARPPVERPDVGGCFPWIGHAGRCGFWFRFPVDGPLPARMDIIGYAGDRPVGRLTTLLRSDFGTAPLPPLHLIQRFTAAPAADFFRADGLKVYSDFKLTMRRHGYPNEIGRMLDWGCGSGRTSVYFLADGNVRDFHGCDIDAEAVSWCRDNLRGGTFTPIEPWPPTPYRDGFFDVVMGFSVFTHLALDVQAAWLAEMRRIIAPGGLFLASTHGEFAASFAVPAGHVGPLRSRGKAGVRGWLDRLRGKPLDLLGGRILDEANDPTLDGVAPQGYYRGVLQARAHTLREFAKHFEIVEYFERGAGNYQDLLVMRRPA